MKWNWQQEDWPSFEYDQSQIEPFETEFLHKSGLFLGVFKHIKEEEREDLKINLICDEALKTSEIEGEHLDRDSIQSSIRKNFGLKTDRKKVPKTERGIAELMTDLYQNFSEPLTREGLNNWYSMVIHGRRDLDNSEGYRTDEDPMQVVSGPVHNPVVHFEAPPSKKVKKEMDLFIKWFNNTNPQAKKALPTLTRAAIAHLYFVCLHPYEDGNGRIARALAEKSLSQSLGQATLIALSITIEKKRKEYYDALEYSNKNLEITDWIKYFAQMVLEAQDYSQSLVEFLLKKAKFFELNKDKLNPRQEKVIDRIFQEGLEGFEGGLSAENYISITKTSSSTATRDLQDLVEKGIFTRRGELKSTRYELNL